ncbi:DsbA family oxidoreductase [Patulibacter sp. SYSU D01012]|uniref:DsbA family oxidoreductase n=1 Tax=Patulibacter sp. SYSU D01012 TaxID=2817381 RepID=UPI001B30D955|nr:DsbA family oxidoreductase [Patulibacter sp. SYSU D01012]
MELEIWSDVACPFCYIGKRQIEAALERFDHRDDVQVRWRSFQLDPTTPKVVDGTIDELLATKYGRSVEEAHEMNARVIGMAEGVGLRYDFDALKPSNTYDAHRVIQLARERGVQDAVKERLLRGYFVEGERLSDHATLARLAGDAGLDAAEVAGVLADERAYAADVDADLELAREFGLSGVPSFVIDRRYLVTGAQPADALLSALDQAWAERQPA